MATESLTAPIHDTATLTRLIQRWDRRRRLTQAFAWFPRSLMPGLFVALVIGVISRFRPLLANDEIALLALVGLVVGAAVTMVAVMFWPRPAIESAREFDRTFGLQERVSTALELSGGQIHTQPLLTEAQIADAESRAGSVDARERLPFVFIPRDWIITALLALMVVALVLIPNEVSADSTADEDSAGAAIDAAADDVRDIIEDVATDTALDAAERESLLEALQVDLETLEDEAISEEEALATLNNAQTRLEEAGFEQQAEAERQQQALESASSSLQGDSGTDSAQQSEAGAEGASASQSLQDLRDQLDAMDEAAQQQAADALEAAADALEATSPEAAQALREAAEALRNGDTEAADEAMERAQDAIQEAEGQQSAQQQSAEQLQQNAQQAASAAQSLTQPGEQSQGEQQQGQQGQQQQGQQGQQQQQGQQSQGEQPQGQQQQGQQGQQGQGQQSQGEQGQENASGQQGQGETGESDSGQLSEEESGGSPGDSAGGQPGEAGAQAPSPGESASGEAAQQQGTGQQGQAGQAGNQAGSMTDDTAGAAPGQIEAEGSSDQLGGQGEFEEVFPGRRPGGDDTGIDVQLDPGEGDVPLEEGDFTENPEGDVTVPYSEVFADYENAANAALDRDYVPLGMRDIVRDYFTSLAPNGEPAAGDSGE